MCGDPVAGFGAIPGLGLSATVAPPRCGAKGTSLVRGFIDVPPPLLLDLDRIDPNATVATREEIYSRLPQRHEFMQLDGVCLIDRQNGRGVTYRDVRSDEWWVRGHIPGRPIFPGALMLEGAAQSAAFLTAYTREYDGFMAFGGVDACKFRGAVRPPARVYFLCRTLEDRPRRIMCHVQGVCNRQLVFDGRITGLAMAP